MSDDPYVYPGTKVLRNKVGATTQAALDKIERQLYRHRALDGIPPGDFDLPHLQAIHRHLFQDIYDWAGELRTVELSKGGHQFMFRQFIQVGMSDIHRRIVGAGFFEGLRLDETATMIGPILGDVNYIHPFREGNGRTQLQYLKQLCGRAGHYLDLRCIDGVGWIKASRLAHSGNYGPMVEAIRAGLSSSRER